MLFYIQRIATDIENKVRVVVYIRKDVEDNSQTIEKEGQTVTQIINHKVYMTLKNMSTRLKVLPFQVKEQYMKL